MRFSFSIRCGALAAVLAATGCQAETQTTVDAPPAPPAATLADDGEDVPVAASGDAYADTDPSALTDFHGALDAHGTWVDDDEYGTVWLPAGSEVGGDFVPYASGGHWDYADDDWVWVSDWSWGWAPFHYGRWVEIEGRGWCWIPGRAYHGAWVVWRVGDDGYGYVGWAPMPPAYVWRGGVAISFGGPVVEPRYVFCARADVFTPGLRGRVVVGGAAAPMMGATHVYARPDATPSGHPFAQAPMRGPAPSALGVEHAPVAGGHVDAGVAHAQQFARPSTAAPLGGHPATSHVVRRPPASRGGGRRGGGGHHR